jgi:hypothetical protein
VNWCQVKGRFLALRRNFCAVRSFYTSVSGYSGDSRRKSKNMKKVKLKYFAHKCGFRANGHRFLEQLKYLERKGAIRVEINDSEKFVVILVSSEVAKLFPGIIKERRQSIKRIIQAIPEKDHVFRILILHTCNSSNICVQKRWDASQQRFVCTFKDACDQQGITQ